MTEPRATATDAVLTLQNLTTSFATDEGWVSAVDDVSLSVRPGETLGIVGESGCGKSVTARSVLRLHDPRSTRYAGQILHDGVDLLALSEREIRAYRGGAISMIFQDPMTSLNPVYKIGSQIAESLRLHRAMNAQEARREATELLRRMRIPDPEGRLDVYPHELSGGMRQRIMIAIALASNPKVLIADEPTTALDVTTQAQILELLADLKRELDMAMIFITHDLGVVREVCDRIAVMYLGRVVEEGPTAEVLENPQHPYTQGLMSSAPGVIAHRSQGRLTVIPGKVPTLTEKPAGCRFEPRCPYATDQCRAQEPPQLTVSEVHAARCWYAGTAFDHEPQPRQRVLEEAP